MKRKLLVGALALVVFAVAVLSLVPPAKWASLILRPGHDFDPARLSPPPDYTSEASWVALPDRDDLADLVPPGVDVAAGARPADAFYIHPTTYYSSAEWNAPLDDERAREMRDLTIANQASAFNACCRVYAPVYRQAAIGAYFDVDDNNLAAFRVAYQDVATAFRHYLAVYNQGRPFIIASHSQGTQHALRLLREIAASEAGARVVAAYVVGYSVTAESLAVPACAGATDTGCAVSWDTAAEGAGEPPEMPHPQWQGERLVPIAGARHCTNPISWSLDGELAPAAQHLGSLLVELNVPMGSFANVVFADGPLGMAVTGLSAPEPATVRARCQEGFLRVPRQSNPVRADFESSTGTYHLFDYDLFYMDIRQNAVDRVAAFIAEG